jgi:phosphate:Na+ symporter
LRNQDDPDKSLADKLAHREQVLDSMQDEIAEFVTNLLSANVPHSVADEARQQLRMADEYESISDYILNLDRFDRKLRRDDQRFTEEQRQVLSELHNHTAEYVSAINEALVQKNTSVITTSDSMAKRIKSEIKQLRRKHLENLSSGAIPPIVSVAYLATLNAYSRVKDHTQNIAEAVSGEK